MSQILKNKIIRKKAKICVIGLGYVGLPCLINFAKSGFKLIGIDLNKSIVFKLKKNINHLNNEKFDFKNLNIDFYDNYSQIKACDVLIVCVPTPLTIYKTPDLSNLKQTINFIGSKLVTAGRIVLNEIVQEIFEKNKYQSPCYSGNLSGVMYPEGQVYPCEILDESHKIGNIRDFNLDFRKLWLSQKAKNEVNYIRKSKCFCFLVYQ